MDLAPNSTKSIECLKGYSAKAGFVLTRGVGWKLPTFPTHYTSYRFVCFSFPLPLATFPVAHHSPRQTASPLLRVVPDASSCPLGNDEMSRPPAHPPIPHGSLCCVGPRMGKARNEQEGRDLRSRTGGQEVASSI
jgi:hypothetical protein